MPNDWVTKKISAFLPENLVNGEFSNDSSFLLQNLATQIFTLLPKNSKLSELEIFEFLRIQYDDVQDFTKFLAKLSQLLIEKYNIAIAVCLLNLDSKTEQYSEKTYFGNAVTLGKSEKKPIIHIIFCDNKYALGQSPKDLLELNRDVLSSILRFLSLPELLQLSFVSKTVRSIVQFFLKSSAPGKEYFTARLHQEYGLVNPRKQFFFPSYKRLYIETNLAELDQEEALRQLLRLIRKNDLSTIEKDISKFKSFLILNISEWIKGEMCPAIKLAIQFKRKAILSLFAKNLVRSEEDSVFVSDTKIDHARTTSFVSAIFNFKIEWENSSADLKTDFPNFDFNAFQLLILYAAVCQNNMPTIELIFDKPIDFTKEAWINGDNNSPLYAIVEKNQVAALEYFLKQKIVIGEKQYWALLDKSIYYQRLPILKLLLQESQTYLGMDIATCINTPYYQSFTLFYMAFQYCVDPDTLNYLVSQGADFKKACPTKDAWKELKDSTKLFPHLSDFLDKQADSLTKFSYFFSWGSSNKENLKSTFSKVLFSSNNQNSQLFEVKKLLSNSATLDLLRQENFLSSAILGLFYVPDPDEHHRTLIKLFCSAGANLTAKHSPLSDPISKELTREWGTGPIVDIMEKICIPAMNMIHDLEDEKFVTAIEVNAAELTVMHLRIFLLVKLWQTYNSLEKNFTNNQKIAGLLDTVINFRKYLPDQFILEKHNKTLKKLEESHEKLIKLGSHLRTSNEDETDFVKEALWNLTNSPSDNPFLIEFSLFINDNFSSNLDLEKDNDNIVDINNNNVNKI